MNYLTIAGVLLPLKRVRRGLGKDFLGQDFLLEVYVRFVESFVLKYV